MTKEKKEGQGEEEGESRGGLQTVSPTQLIWNMEFELNNNEIENPLINRQSCQSRSAYIGSAQAEMESGRREKVLAFMGAVSDLPTGGKGKRLSVWTICRPHRDCGLLNGHAPVAKEGQRHESSDAIGKQENHPGSSSNMSFLLVISVLGTVLQVLGFILIAYTVEKKS